ncbi:MAG: holo-ACP synthase [Opitutae bacterium]
MNLPEIPQGTNVVGVGIDQIEVSRIRESIERHGENFLAKVFTKKEQIFCMERSDPAPCLAARFAAKEAVAKALGTGIGKEFGWLDMEVAKEKSGQPVARFSDHGKSALVNRKASTALLSLSHLNEIASAVVVLIK